MITSTYNPLDAANELKEAGIAPEHAEAIARNINLATHMAHDDSATKADLQVVKTDLQAAISELRASMYRALWIQGAGIIAILTALRLLPGQ